MKKTVRIWIWIFNERLYKAVCREDEGTLILYDEHDIILIKRTGLTPIQMKLIENNLVMAGAKRIDGKEEPFTYL